MRADNLDILFLGGLFPKEKEKEILENSKGYVQIAANVLQQGIVLGLDSNCKGQARILNSLYVGSFPCSYRELFIKTYPFSHTDGAKDINVGYLNLAGITRITRFLSLKPFLKKWVAENNGKKKVIIAYAATATFTGLLKYVKKRNRNIITCLVVPDLPQYMSMAHLQSPLYKMLKWFEVKLIMRDSSYIDGFVLLTEQMKNALKIKVPHTLLEGVASDIFENIEDNPQNSDIKKVLYTGDLSSKYGIIDLINAFKQLPEENCRLIICGTGNTEELLKRESLKDKRIEFKGLVTREEALGLQKSATVLINPRPNNEEYTKYSFPSKILEYLSSGRPVISYKLDGIPEEYFDHMYTIDEGEGEEVILAELKKVLSKAEEELSEKGRKAREFVLAEKNAAVQTKKIIEMIVEISKTVQQ